ncbi:MAG: winged helix-turn-helix domain-containing protein [Candidatus Woesearchaeota archaeon]
MSERKRERMEVIYDILSAIRDKNNSIKPTRLMQACNLSTPMFKQYIEELLQKEFVLEITNNKGQKFFSLREKGFRFLEQYQKIVSFVKDFGL